MKFSIITPSYGQLDWLRLCVASVADQIAPEAQYESTKVKGGKVQDLPTFEPSNLPTNGFGIEHIIQDGGTPGILDFVKEFSGELGLTIVSNEGEESLRATKPGYTLRLYSEPDQGMYDAINRGITRMTGSLWAWINSDEQYLPGTLPFVWEWFGQNPETDILCGDALLVDGKGEALSYRRIIPPQWLHTRLVHLSSLSCASFYRRTVLSRGGNFDTTWRSIGDAEWMARLLQSGLKVKSCHKLLSTFAFTGQNTSESPRAAWEGAKWRVATDAPPPWLRIPVVIHHRIRKMVAGSYNQRTLSYSLHQKASSGRLEYVSGRIGWGWPGSFAYQKARLVKIGKSDTGPVWTLNLFDVLGTLLAETSYEELSRMLAGYVRADVGPLAVDFANTHVVTLRRHDAEFSHLTESIDLTLPDGMPLVWVMNRKGAELKDRVYGPTFTRKFLEECPAGLTHYLVGGSEECGEKFQERMLALNPSLQFVGAYHGTCSADGVLEEDKDVLDDIRRKRPDFIWVGLGTPKQYGWINRIKPQLDHGVLLAVGFAFDVNAGMKPDAPAWMQPLGLTWLYRMASEPKRLVGRYVKFNSLFLGYLLLDSRKRKTKNGNSEAENPKKTEDPKGQCNGKTEEKGGIDSFKNRLPERRLPTTAYKPETLILRLRNLMLKVIDLFASDINDCQSGEKLGRGLLFGFGKSIHLIGYEGRPLVPKFLVQRRLTYWHQTLGFTAHKDPDFPRNPFVSSRQRTPSENPRVMNILLMHRAGAAFQKLKEIWKPICAEEDLWIAFGGTRKEFAELETPRKVFIDDPRLRVRDQQRDKQCYGGIFRAMAPLVERESPDFLYFCEYDHIPLIPDLNRRQVAAMREEGADMMGHWLYRIDGTGHYHYLYHKADPDFAPFWQSVSRREDPTVIFSIFGTGSFWSRDAFLAVAKQPQPIECYLEIYLPTLAHHLGFRVRRWNEEQHLISNIPLPNLNIEEALKQGCWTVHPVKDS